MRLILLTGLLVAVALGLDTCAEGLGEFQPVLLPRPAFEGQEALTEVWVEPLDLELESATPNAITDDADWFERNGLSLPLLDVPNPFRGTRGGLPKGIPTECQGLMLVRAIDQGDRYFLLYGRDFGDGRLLVCLDSTLRRVLYAFDFSGYVVSPDYLPEDREFVDQALAWAEERDGILYVSHAHRTYAASSKGMNGYVTAIDVRSGTVAWRTKPLVCNSGNFVIRDDVILCGYGFTAEPDFVYQLNRHTGAEIARTPVKTAADWLVVRGERLYVRCYDTDYVFRLGPGR